MSSQADALNPLQDILRRQSFREFVKFCIVGASSTVISTAVYTYCVYWLRMDAVLHSFLEPWPAVQAFAERERLYANVSLFAGFLIAVSNGFFWNSRWTFRQSDPSQRTRQYGKFFLVNVVGLVLNQFILWLVLRFLAQGRKASELTWEPMGAFAVAVGIVVFWNFSANKFWTFRR